MIASQADVMNEADELIQSTPEARAESIEDLPTDCSQGKTQSPVKRVFVPDPERSSEE